MKEFISGTIIGWLVIINILMFLDVVWPGIIVGIMFFPLFYAAVLYGPPS